MVPADSAGLEVAGRDKLMGIKALPTYLVTLADVRVPAANRWAVEGVFTLR